MTDRHALILDEDEAFRVRLAELLSPSGLVLTEAADAEEALSLLERLRPEVVFIGVDLPDKEGFSVFSKVKKVQRNVPVVLVTSTVPKSDLKLHETLRVHAEVYLDKSDLSDDTLLEALAEGASLDLEVRDEPPKPAPDKESEPTPELEPGPDLETEPSPEPESEPGAPESGPGLPSHVAEYLDPESVAILAEIDEEANGSPRSQRPKTAKGDVTPERLEELEEHVERLHRELEHARRDARSSPFSSEFLNLRESQGRKDEEIRALSESLARRDAQTLVVKRKLTELATRLATATQERDEDRERATEIQERFEANTSKLETLESETEEIQKRHDEEIRRLKDALAEEQVGVTVVRHELEGQIAELRAAHAETAKKSETERAVALKELERILREEHASASGELKAKYSAKLEETEKSQSRLLNELRKEHEEELVALRKTQKETLERATREAREALQQSAAKSAEALEQSNQQRVAELARAEQKRRADLAASEKRLEAKIAALVKKHTVEREDLEHKVEAAVKTNDQMIEEVNAKVQDVLKNWENERKSHYETKERYEREAALLQETHTKNLEKAEQDQFTALAGLSRKFREDRTKALEMERRRWQEKAASFQKEHAEALTALQKHHKEEAKKRDAAQEAALQQKDRDAVEMRREALDKARLEHTEALERARRDHENQLALLRQKNDKAVSALGAKHMEALAERDRQGEQTLRDTLEHVKTDHATHVERLSEEHAKALSALRKDGAEELAALEKAHRANVAQQESHARSALKSVEEERDEARVTADALRAELAEVAAKHRSSFKIEEEKHKAELSDVKKELKSKVSRLEEERQFLAASVEKIKRQSTGEVKRLTERLTHEKQIHQATRDRYEHRLSELKDRHAEGIKRVESDWMEKLEHLEKSLNERSEQLAAAAEHEWKAKLETSRLQEEETIASLRNEFEMELAASAQKLDRALAFEASYQEASREITKLKTRLDELASELSDARGETRERDELVRSSEKKARENQETIDSLKAVINDFSRSVDGYLQDRDDQDQTISSLKAVIDDVYRSIGGPDEPAN